IVSVAFGVPVFGFSFHEKTKRFYSEIGRGEYQEMLENNMDCIDDWMHQLKRGEEKAWNLSKVHLDKIKELAKKNYVVLDDYIKSVESSN
ncbi:MAG: hypothetical protein ACK4ND_19540, partial [Cytophagaceae bacterium]